MIFVVCDTAKVRFFKQITTKARPHNFIELLFAILQKYDFSSKSQHWSSWFCKSSVVCDTAKVRFFKQITTAPANNTSENLLFAILQKYDFSSKSQLYEFPPLLRLVVCDTAKVRFFKQITTDYILGIVILKLFAILQKYDFSSKSQPLQITTFPNNVVCDTAKVRFFKQITTLRIVFTMR